jgi:hypothetical protein
MNLSILSENINIKYHEEEPQFSNSYIYERPHFKIEEDDFFLNIKDVARYRVCNGQTIWVNPYKEADEKSVNLFLEGSVLGAVLHQRGLLPFHASSFKFKDKGIIVCGVSGAGKSSVTAAFCQKEGVFINDDISPVSVSGSEITILPVKTKIKLWKDTLKKLKISEENLSNIRPEIDKFYLPVEKKINEQYKLDCIFVLSSHQKDEYIARELNGLEKYNVLRKQIYKRIYLKGMPETEKKYFKQLFLLAKNVPVISITRPAICNIHNTMDFIKSRFYNE